MGRIQDIGDEEEIEVINFWIEPAMLSGLITLANYDRNDNDHVIIPFASGCQAVWTLPYKEKSQQYPRAVVGGMDPVVRGYLSNNMLIFALASERFIEMTDNINGSFLQDPLWSSIIERRDGSKAHYP